jgi:hypothetical protein
VAGEVPQAFEAVTVTDPPVEPTVAVRKVAFGVHLHPPGTVQV